MKTDPSIRNQVASLWGEDAIALPPSPAPQAGTPTPGGAAACGHSFLPSAPAAPLGLLSGNVTTLRIPGKPQPGGSKRAFTPRGWSRPVITDANPKAADWKRTVQVFAQQSRVSVMEGPLRVSATFFLARPQGHFGTRGLRPSAPPFPHRKPDVLKLMRSTEDALTGLAWRDDAQIVDEHIRKVYSTDGWTGVVIEVGSVT